jgi:hypothetical protein
VHVAPACARSVKGSDHFGSYMHNISLHLCKRLFLGLEPITSWSQGNNFTAAPGLAPACERSGEGSDHFGSYVRSLPLLGNEGQAWHSGKVTPLVPRGNAASLHYIAGVRLASYNPSPDPTLCGSFQHWVSPFLSSINRMGNIM